LICYGESGLTPAMTIHPPDGGLPSAGAERKQNGQFLKGVKFSAILDKCTDFPSLG
jgi:hypothetical protein